MSATAAAPAVRRARGKAGFRPDVEGLRAVAVVSVLLYHAGVGVFGGGYVGVDVFFVISGYLITGLLLREMEGTGRVSVAAFYGRRAKRLLPTLAVVLVTVSVVAWLLFPPLRRASAYLDVIASGMYVVNWWLASQAVDYAAVGSSVSPVQHIWSLAVEEQFYLVWPLLMLGATWWWRRRGTPSRGALVAALGVVSVASFAYCVHLTDTEAGVAYFSTLARAWELGVGGVLAVVLARPGRAPGRHASVVLWVLGAAAVAFAVLRFTDDTLFPGAWAAVPVLGAAALIAAGAAPAGSTDWPQRLLTLRPMRHIGRLSYTWYLWHWPLLVFANALWGHLPAALGLLVVAAAYVPTLLTHLLVEEPFRRSALLARAPKRALLLGLACTALVAGTAGTLRVVTPTLPTATPQQAAGAKVLHSAPTTQVRAHAVRPAPQHASGDRGRIYADGCLVFRRKTVSPRCVYGDRSAPTTVVLFGDSHAMQWSPALFKVAQRRHWRLVALVKSSCPPADVAIFDDSLRREYTECETWRRHALARIRRIRPAMVLVSSLTSYSVLRGPDKLGPQQSHRRLREGYREVLQRLEKVSPTVVAIGDSPHHMKHADDCVAANPDHLQACSRSREKARPPQPLLDAAHQLRRVRALDPISAFCPEDTCPAVIGNTLVYRNADHVTATYAATLDDWLGRRLPNLK